ncbi:hypothetical protein PENTCL1PPCAC_16128 [Pristionchus entomophagus]|uniref:Secreted protein n=1 Tax=Pristionchus entomophagus TaxID=358040 RepID=A0AAV5TI87_9BILA|nr:hypothetical protein PENTCL1PPCAC_16128 [Pristionchus entomophagus]
MNYLFVLILLVSTLRSDATEQIREKRDICTVVYCRLFPVLRIPSFNISSHLSVTQQVTVEPIRLTLNARDARRSADKRSRWLAPSFAVHRHFSVIRDSTVNGTADA